MMERREKMGYKDSTIKGGQWFSKTKLEVSKKFLFSANSLKSISLQIIENKNEEH